MKELDFFEGFMVGMFLAAIILLTTFGYLENKGRYECEMKLPRTEKCIQVWIPEQK